VAIIPTAVKTVNPICNASYIDVCGLYYTASIGCDVTSQFDCGDAVCIDKSLVCNGRVNCNKSRDEANCTSSDADSRQYSNIWHRRSFCHDNRFHSRCYEVPKREKTLRRNSLSKSLPSPGQAGFHGALRTVTISAKVKDE